jgi:uncharacterized protein (TIGR03435 family)
MRARIAYATVLLMVALFADASLRGQSATKSSFEVASIKPSPAGPPSGPSGFQAGGRYVAHSVTASRLLVLAFRTEGLGTGLRPEQIVNAPGWMESARYDIEAKVSGPTTAAPIADPEASTLLRSLLEDRFKLQAHMEKRELPFYALVLAKPDGTFGPTLKRSTLDCDAINRERDAARRENRTPQVPLGPAVCALRLGQGVGTGTGASMVTLASLLTAAVGSTVLDRTGLSGGFDIDVHYAVESRTNGAIADASSDSPSIFTAVQEQLGLKLEQRREPRDVLVIDHVERPTED